MRLIEGILVKLGLALILLIGLSKLTYAAYDWRNIPVGSDVSEARAVAIDENNPDVIYVGLKEALYKTIDRGKSWELSAPGLITAINSLYIDKQDAKTVYAATRNGLFRSQDCGINWQKIFFGKDVLEQDVLAIALCYQPPKSVFIATGKGVFFSPVNRITWQKVGGKLSDAGITAIITEPDNSDTLFIVSSNGLFKTQNRLSSYERIYVAFGAFESEDTTTDVDSGEEEITPQDYFLRHLALDPGHGNRVYLASSKGLLFSPDGGKSWQKRIFSGLLDERINYILAANEENRFFLATQNGVFDCQGDSCKQLYSGANFRNCLQLAQDEPGNLYAACDKGLYRMPAQDSNPRNAPRAESIGQRPFSQEPTIQQIQKEAIKYAEVYPEKIAHWRKQARIKALLPELSLDYDKTVTTALGATYDRVQVGPRDWGLTLKWDLADLIFSADQTSIDVRSRLMVQLRDDILNEVTRLYFERRRLQFELGKAENLDKKSMAEKGLRLEELTASIDGLTGGYITRSLNTTGE